MSVFMMIAAIKEYIDNCPSDLVKEEAALDFIDAIKEIKKAGYTWGQVHQLPFKFNHIEELAEEDIDRLTNIVKNVSNSN